MPGLLNRISTAYNVFKNPDLAESRLSLVSSELNQGQHRWYPSNMITAKKAMQPLLNRISINVASGLFKHIYQDEDGLYVRDASSNLNECLTVSANIDQTGRDFIQDAVMSLLEEGVMAMVPTETSGDPYVSNSYDIYSLRTGKILEWYTDSVRVEVYNEKTGKHEQIRVSKRVAAVVYNPMSEVMNTPNSTLSRLLEKLALLDAVDNQSGSGKLDIIIQVPYVVKSVLKKELADKRRAEIEEQLQGSKYGIAYIDGTEKVTQLNRPAENQLMAQVEYLTSMLYSQLGISENVFDGTANEIEMLAYYGTTVHPLALALTDAMNKTFMTKTARTQGQRIRYFSDRFKMVPTVALATIATSLKQGEIGTGNEFRNLLGFKKVETPKADDLNNSNINPNPAVPATNKLSEGEAVNE
jgi:hypothetical protein